MVSTSALVKQPRWVESPRSSMNTRSSSPPPSLIRCVALGWRLPTDMRPPLPLLPPPPLADIRRGDFVLDGVEVDVVASREVRGGVVLLLELKVTVLPSEPLCGTSLFFILPTMARRLPVSPPRLPSLESPRFNGSSSAEDDARR